MTLRADRIDRLQDGTLTVLDYKSGARKRFLDGSGQPREIQLVAYSCAIDEPVAALALVNIDSREIVFTRGTTEAINLVAHSFVRPRLAAGDVHMHARARRMLQDTLTAIRTGNSLQHAGFALYPNGERCLRPLSVLQELYPQALLDETLAVLERIDFSLDELRYEYPNEIVPEGETPATYLRRLTEAGMQRRWPEGVPRKVTGLIEHELALIADLRYEPYFLTVYDIVAYARSQGILCQGRGSAANSAVCFCLGITEVDPARMAMLVERFIS